MAATSMVLLSLLSTKSEISRLTLQEMMISSKYERNQSAMNKQLNLEEKYNDAIADAQDSEKTIDVAGFHKDKGYVCTDAQAEAYARIKVKYYDAEYLEELNDLDMRYDAMKTLYETQLTQAQEKEKNLNQLLTTSIKADASKAAGGNG